MAKTNKGITFKGSPLTIEGKALAEGSKLPSFRVTANDLSDYSDQALKGKVAVISAVPSLDTPVCSMETKRFNNSAEEINREVVILTVSMDLPFAQKRWCAAEGVKAVVTASDYKYREFGEAFGVYIKELGLLSRAVFVVDKTGTIIHVDYVKEVTEEPDYAAVLAKVAMVTE